MIKLNYPKFWENKNIISTLLLIFTPIYLFASYVRTICTKSIRLPGFVICVGNMTVGGSGKTQLVAWLAHHFTRKKYRFLIITKAYKSNLKGAKLVDESDTAWGVGDESVLLRKYGQVLATKSIKDALPIIEKFKPEVIIFDDGMQNPGFIKDFILLVIDAERNIGNGRLLPAGPLRQLPHEALDLADYLIMIGEKRCPNQALRIKIADHNKILFRATIGIKGDIDARKKYYAFTAIGDPGRFFNLLMEVGVDLIGSHIYPDHYHYTSEDIMGLKEEAKRLNALLITTMKDYVKLPDTTGIVCAESFLHFDSEKELLKRIYEKIKAHR